MEIRRRDFEGGSRIVLEGQIWDITQKDYHFTPWSVTSPVAGPGQQRCLGSTVQVHSGQQSFDIDRQNRGSTVQTKEESHREIGRTKVKNLFRNFTKFNRLRFNEQEQFNKDCIDPLQFFDKCFLTSNNKELANESTVMIISPLNNTI